MSLERIGRYEILRTLGRGAMGVVYLARDPLIDREVALKTLRVDLDEEVAAEFRERFLREARAAGRLNHPGIVTIHDVGEDAGSGLVYIAMEFVRGRDLKQILLSGHRFRPAEAARIVADVAQALDYAHSMGVVHRDVKPANILLTEGGRIRIMDFGVARLESSNLTTEGQFIGTPNYMSPEQVTGHPVDGRSDLFSLGVVLYELLVGQRPFPGDSIHEVTLKLVQQPTPIPSAVAPSLPPAFNPIVLKCLEKEPAQRFQRGSELARVLAAIARSLVVRDPADAGSTAVVAPDLGTHPAVPARREPSTADRRPVPLLSLRQRLLERLPDPLGQEVRMVWVVRILAACSLLVALTAGVLALRRDTGPFVAPSAGGTRNLRLTFEALERGNRLLAAGDAVGAEAAAHQVLDQAPASPAGRRLAAAARTALAAQRSSDATRARAAELVTEGRRLYRQGQFAAAAALFEQALAIGPEDELAESYLELARERARPARDAAAPRTERRPPSAASVPTARPQPTPGVARLTVFFNSPINAGSLLVTLDGDTLARIPFDFTRSGFLGIKRRGAGQVQRVLLAPSGRHEIAIRLDDSERGALGAERFEAQLEAGSDWTLRVDLPEGGLKPGFFLVRARAR